MIGLFIFAAIGIAVLMDLWDIVDMKSGFRPVRCTQDLGKSISYLCNFRLKLLITLLLAQLLSAYSPSVYTSFGSMFTLAF